MPPGSRLGAVERDPSLGARPSCGSLTMFAAADFGRRARSLAGNSVDLPPPVSKSRRRSAGRTRQLELIKGGHAFQSDCGCARPTLRPPSLRNRPAFPDRPHPGGPAVYKALETLLQLEGVHGSPALRSAGLLLGEGRAQDSPGDLALPWRRDHALLRLSRGLCPYMEVATWPGVPAAGGGATEQGGRGERRWAGALLGEENSIQL